MDSFEVGNISYAIFNRNLNDHWLLKNIKHQLENMEYGNISKFGIFTKKN